MSIPPCLRISSSEHSTGIFSTATFTPLLLLCLLLFRITLHAGDTFFVTDQRGGRSDRVELKNGTTFRIDGRTYWIEKETSDARDVVEQMESMVIPQISFSKATVDDVLASFQRASAQSHNQERATGDRQRSQGDNLSDRLFGRVSREYKFCAYADQLTSYNARRLPDKGSRGVVRGAP